MIMKAINFTKCLPLIKNYISISVFGGKERLTGNMKHTVLFSVTNYVKY